MIATSTKMFRCLQRAASVALVGFLLILPSISRVAGNDLSQHQRPNVLFIAVDDLRPQLPCYGHEEIIAPNIERLAAEGVVFRRAYCQVPVCGASRASLLTGVRPTRTQFLTWHTWVNEEKPGVATLPGHFKDNGYRTISNGKIFHYENDRLDSWCETPWKRSGNIRGYYSRENKASAAVNNGYGQSCEMMDVPDNTYFDGQIADKTITDLDRLAEMDKPFFLAVGFIKPHLPFNAPKTYWDLYQESEIKLADNPFSPQDAPNAALHNWGELRPYLDIPNEGPLPDSLARQLIHGYYASVSFTDAQIGRVLAKLDALGLVDNTIIILWGDHGWQLGEHGLWCKHCNFETSLHVPLIVKAPKVAGRRSCNRLVEFVDIYPTLCELCELPMPEHLEGTSFVPLLEDTRRKWKKAAFSRYKQGDSIRVDQYRYTEWTDDAGNVYARMLYDHRIDPAENTNLAELPEHQDIVKQLSKILRSKIEKDVARDS